MKLIQGICFNVAVLKTANGTNVCSIQLRTTDGAVWKFQMNTGLDSQADFTKIFEVMNAKTVTVSTEECSKGN